MEKPVDEVSTTLLLAELIMVASEIMRREPHAGVEVISQAMDVAIIQAEQRDGVERCTLRFLQ